MNGILLYLLIMSLPGDSTRVPFKDVTEYYNDSLRLHDVYAYQMSYLKNIKETDTAKWNTRALHDHLVTCGTQKNLEKHNGVSFEPIDSFKRVGCETAYRYPKPLGNKLHHVSYDLQTRFTIRPNGGTAQPYIRKIVYDLDDGSILFEEKKKPIPNADGTYNPLE